MVKTKTPDPFSERFSERTHPDECESQQPGKGGGQGGTSLCANLSEEECLLFWDWAVQQGWGPGCELTGFEQYRVLRDKLEALGLSLEGLMH